MSKDDVATDVHVAEELATFRSSIRHDDDNADNDDDDDDDDICRLPCAVRWLKTDNM